MFKKIILVCSASTITSSYGMNHDMFSHWGSGKYKVIHFSDGPRKIGQDYCDSTSIGCGYSDFIFTHENSLIFKTSILPLNVHNRGCTNSKKHYIAIDLATGNDNEWKEKNSSMSWDHFKITLSNLGGIAYDSYLDYSTTGTATLCNGTGFLSDYFFIDSITLQTSFPESLLHTQKNIMFACSHGRTPFTKSWHIFATEKPQTYSPDLTPLHVTRLGDIPQLAEYEMSDTCFTPDGTTLLVFLKNGTILKIIPEPLIRVRPKAYDTFFRWK